MRTALESRKEIADLFEMIPQLDNGRALEHAFGVHVKLSVVQVVKVGGNEEQVRRALDWQEATARDVESLSVAEVLDSGTNSGFKLDDLFARW
jgi:uncharacterized protein YciU (UPF0263 family)